MMVDFFTKLGLEMSRAYRRPSSHLHSIRCVSYSSTSMIREELVEEPWSSQVAGFHRQKGNDAWREGDDGDNETDVNRPFQHTPRTWAYIRPLSPSPLVLVEKETTAKPAAVAVTLG